jgi:hypothetical protein
MIKEMGRFKRISIRKGLLNDTFSKKKGIDT